MWREGGSKTIIQNKTFLGIYLVYVSQKTQCKYFAQLRHHQENTDNSVRTIQYCMYSPDDALVVRNIYISEVFWVPLIIYLH